MAGVSPPNNERLLQLLGDLQTRLTFLETQQQQTITNAVGQALINFGLVPGADPPRYGLQIMDPLTQAESMFLGEDSGSVTGIFRSGNYAAGSAGFRITPDGNAEFNQLTLRNGIIGDAALTNPVQVGSADGTVASLTQTSTETTYITESITVPSGFTTALVMATCTSGLTANASASVIESRPVINGVQGERIASTAPATDGMSVSSTFATVLTGLSGSFTVQGTSRGTTGNVTANSGNCRISALAVFLR